MSTLSSNPTQSGPSRRSHTKSRKGCKTCKRRHIRCDETFPQCRNCTKHQVRCDYMDASPVPAEPAQAGAMPLIYQPSSAEVETLVDYWIKTGDCTVGDTHIDLNAHGHSYSKVNLRCIYHALSFNMAPETGAFTVWSAKTPRFLQAATAQPFLVHAVLGFGSLAMSWEQGSSDAKSMAHHHGGVALQGLRRAISAFSVENADAVLAASCLLSWQANDWQSWASLINGIRTVVNSMQAWRRDSPLAEIIDEQELAISEDFLSFARSPPVEQSALYYASVLHKIHSALHHLERYLGGRPQDSQWIGQIKDYIERLQAVRPASTPEEQFNHLYAFRKWLFWVPQTLLKSSDWDHMTLIVLSYIYGIALELEPLFPNVASPFISTMSVKPLEEIIGAFLGVPQPEAGTNDSWGTMLQLLAWPRQAAADYRIRGNQQNSGAHMRLSPPSFDMMGSALSQYVDTFSMGGARSPAFGYSPASQVSPISTSSTLSFLDVPAYSDTVGSGGFPSPFVLASMTSEAEAMEATYGFEDTTLSFGGTSGFVDLKPIWT